MTASSAIRQYAAIARALQFMAKNAAARAAKGRSLLLSPTRPPDAQGHIRFAVDLGVLGLHPQPAGIGLEDICCPFPAPPARPVVKCGPGNPGDGWMRDLPAFLKNATALQDQPSPPASPRPRRMPVPISLQKRMHLFPYNPGKN